jgi:hypothetical protein
MPCTSIAAATESTRKGMSSLTIATRMRRRTSSVAIGSIAMAGAWPSRRAAVTATNAAACAISADPKSFNSPGSARSVSRAARASVSICMFAMHAGLRLRPDHLKACGGCEEGGAAVRHVS